MNRKKILIAEDDKDLQEGLNFLFTSQGYKVISAMDGISAVNIAQVENPDLIILDLSLPWADGYKVMERLRASVSLPDIPIIILTGRDASINQERTLKLGAEAFFHKPFDNSQLLAAAEKALEEDAAEKAQRESGKKKILVVDDDKDLLDGLNFLLSSHGYNVITAMDAISVFGLVRKGKPDAILLDLSLPGGDGYQVMERLKSFPPFAHIPIIILTSREASTHQQRAIRAGAEAFFQKPFDNGQLLTVIENALKKSNERR